MTYWKQKCQDSSYPGITLGKGGKAAFLGFMLLKHFYFLLKQTNYFIKVGIRTLNNHSDVCRYVFIYHHR